MLEPRPEAGPPIAPPTASTWIEVDAAALVHNVQAVRSLIPPPTRLMAVVKANVYGHGVEAARVIEQAGADGLAVTTLAEALALRQAGAAGSILVFCPLLPDQIPRALEAGLTLTAGSKEDVQAISAAAAAAGSQAAVHLKIDTGLGRLGVLPENAAALAEETAKLPAVEAEGIYTHFGTAMNQNLDYAKTQLERFMTVLGELEGKGLRPPLAHCSNSAAVLQLPDARLDMVRVGTLLYGQFPAAFLSGRLDLRPTWRMMSRIAAVKEVPAGWSVGYGAEYVTPKPTRLAVIPVGYADGYALEVNARSRTRPAERFRAVARTLRGPGERSVKIKGKQAAVVGRVSMQLITVDVTELPGVVPGDLAEIPCRRVNASPLLPRVLKHSDTAP
ncbi:MAG: alanine racemase [Chloroflexi bacterium]|nr:alanine racemase [Chloroflexota bacterium]